jgi:peptide-methionine (S)-S-oxide reductase
MTTTNERAVLAGGCFWGMQDLIRRYNGVLSTILEFFFQIHDPTTRNRQGNDVGTSYRSAIFYTSDEQRQIAEDTIADVDASGLWPGKVVTDVAPAGEFWEAEPEHQDYLQRYPEGYTCHFVRPNWRLPHRADAVGK